MDEKKEIHGKPVIPVIHEFSADREKAITGQTINVRWLVKDAEKVFINGCEVEQEGSSAHVITEETTFKLEVTAIGLKNNLKKIRTVMVPEPAIEQFSFNPPDLCEDTPNEFGFTLKNAASWQLVSSPLNQNEDETVIAWGLNSNFEELHVTTTSVKVQGACLITLVAISGTRRVRTRPIVLTPLKPKIIDFKADRYVVPYGQSVTLSWEVAEANKVLLQPGNHLVTGQNSFVFKPSEKKEYTLSLVAYGDFGETDIKDISIRVAWLDNVQVHCNYNLVLPRFYITWQENEVFNVKIHTRGKCSTGLAQKFYIVPSDNPVHYELVGETINSEPVKFSTTLYPASITHFDSDLKAFVVGEQIRLQWTVINARKIMVDHGIDDKVEPDGATVILRPGMEVITLTIWGDNNMVKQSIYLPTLKKPEIEKVKVRLPHLNINLSLRQNNFPFPPRPVIQTGAPAGNIVNLFRELREAIKPKTKIK